MDLAAVRHVADLAELSLTAEEEARLADEMGRILAYVSELDALDTSNVPPATQMLAEASGEAPMSVQRPDELAEGLSREQALSGAPATDDGGFVVPGFVEGA